MARVVACVTATAALIPNDRNVYRGMRNPSWSKRGSVSYLAFMLRPATAQFPTETELSLGLTPQSAVDELRENFGVASLSVRAINELPHGLTIRPDPRDATKVEMFGLPTHSIDTQQINLAIAMATDLAGIAYLVPGYGPLSGPAPR